ncbi:MAG: hypothetical protein BRD55_12215 [Bacteroidetes bacterium SW_9_63_38]|nr:MAG: hypothetical protein BRD55_12215 [Bacteroidetes bacterium SW_9_63_38]
MNNASEGPDDPLQFLMMHGGVRNERELLHILHRAFKDASEAIVLTGTELDPPGPQILWVNPAFTEVTGYEPSEVLGQTPRLLQGPETDESELCRLRRRLDAEERFEGETVNYRKDGTPYTNHWSIAPVYGKRGGVKYWVSVQRDVTEKRKLEEQMVRTLDEERRRIGISLHDSVGSSVTTASMKFENFIHRESLESSQEEELEEIRSTIKEAYEELRRISQGLIPGGPVGRRAIGGAAAAGVDHGSVPLRLRHRSQRPALVRRGGQFAQPLLDRVRSRHECRPAR